MDMGYMEVKTGFSADELNKTEMNTQIAKFQQNAGIKVTGTVTASTMVAANSPRCGKSNMEDAGSGGRRKRYSIAGSRSKWMNNRVTWRLVPLLLFCNFRVNVIANRLRCSR